MLIIRTVLLVCVLALLASCNNLKEGIKETGDAVESGVQNIGEALKEVPQAIGDATNKAEQDIRD